jgi:hypothetical protein
MIRGSRAQAIKFFFSSKIVFFSSRIRRACYGSWQSRAVKRMFPKGTGGLASTMHIRRLWGKKLPSGKALCSPRAEEYARNVSDFMQEVSHTDE